MNKVLQLGLRAPSSKPPSLPYVPFRSLRFGSPIVSVRIGTMSLNKRLMSNATLLSVNNSKGKGLKVAAATHHMESDSERDKMGIVGDDQKEIEAMTVQKLRATLRPAYAPFFCVFVCCFVTVSLNFQILFLCSSMWNGCVIMLQCFFLHYRNLGLPVKGLKKELISALRLHIDSNLPDEGSGAEKMETTSSTRSESVTIKRKIRNQEESNEAEFISSEACGNDHGEKKAKQSTEKNLKVKVSSKEEEASLTISSEVFKTSEIVSSSSQSEPWTVLAHKKPEKDWKAYNPKTMRPPSLPEGTKSVKIMAWNVNGLRALLKLESFSALQLAQEKILMCCACRRLKSR